MIDPDQQKQKEYILASQIVTVNIVVLIYLYIHGLNLQRFFKCFLFKVVLCLASRAANCQNKNFKNGLSQIQKELKVSGFFHTDWERLQFAFIEPWVSLGIPIVMDACFIEFIQKYLPQSVQVSSMADDLKQKNFLLWTVFQSTDQVFSTFLSSRFHVFYFPCRSKIKRMCMSISIVLNDLRCFLLMLQVNFHIQNLLNFSLKCEGFMSSELKRIKFFTSSSVGIGDVLLMLDPIRDNLPELLQSYCKLRPDLKVLVENLNE